MQDNQKLMVEVAFYYYKKGLTQSEIASKLLITRQRVNKLIKESRDTGIVEIAIKGSEHLLVDTERSIESRFNIDTCIVIPSPSKEEQLFEKLGSQGAKYLEKLLTNHMSIGISWGKTLYNLTTKMPDLSTKYKDLKVVQVVGSSNTYSSDIRSVSITRLLASKLGANPIYLHSPTFLRESTKKEFMQEPIITHVFDEITTCDILITSIGDLSKYASSLQEQPIDQELYDDLLASDAVGNICLEYLNQDGKSANCALNKRRIGIAMETLAKIDNVIIVAGGTHKIAPLKAVLSGDYVNTLITDENTANLLLAE